MTTVTSLLLLHKVCHFSISLGIEFLFMFGVSFL